MLLLHGLMGRASHWASTARWLAERHRAVALDQRGHGRATSPPDGPYTREAYVEDAEAAIEQLGLGPVTLIGHAMGALTAWQLAAKRPDLVRALSSATCGPPRWARPRSASGRTGSRPGPLPFATLADVRQWFGEDDPWVERPNPARGEFFAEVMQRGPDGWRPVFDPAPDAHVPRDLGATTRTGRSWPRSAAPPWSCAGLDGELGRAEAQEMVRVLPRGEYAEVADAGHLAHYDQPAAWRGVIEPFLERVCWPG